MSELYVFALVPTLSSGNAYRYLVWVAGCFLHWVGVCIPTCSVGTRVVETVEHKAPLELVEGIKANNAKIDVLIDDIRAILENRDA